MGWYDAGTRGSQKKTVKAASHTYGGNSLSLVSRSNAAGKSDPGGGKAVLRSCKITLVTNHLPRRLDSGRRLHPVPLFSDPAQTELFPGFLTTPPGNVPPPVKLPPPSLELLSPSFILLTPFSELPIPPFELLPPSFQLLSPSLELLSPPLELLPPPFELLSPSSELLPPSLQLLPPSFQLPPPSSEGAGFRHNPPDSAYLAWILRPIRPP